MLHDKNRTAAHFSKSRDTNGIMNIHLKSSTVAPNLILTYAPLLSYIWVSFPFEHCLTQKSHTK